MKLNRGMLASAAKYTGLSDVLKSTKSLAYSALTRVGYGSARRGYTGLMSSAFSLRKGLGLGNEMSARSAYSSAIYHGIRATGMGSAAMPWQQRATRIGMMGMGAYGMNRFRNRGRRRR